eukprot:UN16221
MCILIVKNRNLQNETGNPEMKGRVYFVTVGTNKN